jgi:methylated-DNA-[protein]-cysteine S-methyltransferase
VIGVVTLSIDGVKSEIGEILLVVKGDRLCALSFSDSKSRTIELLRKRYGEILLIHTPNPQGFSDRLRSYFSGDYSSLDDLPVTTDGTQFQQQVWSALRSIPAGTTVSYQELAARIGQENACRAVGLANSRNPISIVLPCHRVIGKNSDLTGYAGGLMRKSWLLRHEGIVPAAARESKRSSDFIQMSLL